MKRKSIALLLAFTLAFGNYTSVFAADMAQDIIVEDESPDVVNDAAYIPDDLDVVIDDEDEEIDIVNEAAEEIQEEVQEEPVVEEAGGEERQLPPMTAQPVRRERPFDTPQLYSGSSYNADYLADKYINENIPKLRDQGKYGTCWAQSALALAEINLMSKGLVTSDVDYSEVQLAYFVFNTPMDPLGGFKGDYTEMTIYEMATEDIPYSFMNRGGNGVFAQVALSSWIGAADDAAFPYSEAEKVIKNGLPESAGFEDSAHLKNYYNIGITAADQDPSEIAEITEAAKRLIVDHGALSISYNANASGKDKNGNVVSYYNNEYNSFYRPIRTDANHAVTIVGWDDNFPKDHFTVEAPGNGAWLIRNSWFEEGVDPNEDAQHRESYWGYFWMSYYEGSLENFALAFEFDTADNYDHNYQYDGAAESAYRDSDKAANVFTVHGGNGKEVLKAVGISNANTDSIYKLEIYRLNKDFKDPEDGTLLETVTGELTYEGFYTIPLDSELSFDQNDVFSVVYTSTYADPEAHAGKEVYYTEKEYTVENTFAYINAAAQKNQSFLFEDNQWLDVGESMDVNVRIKAFTDDASKEPDTKEYTIEYKPEPGKLVQGVDYKAKYKSGEEFTFNATEAPKGYQFEGWYADEALKSLKNGIEKSDKRNITVYAKYVPIDYTVAFDANGGEGTMDVLKTKYDEYFMLPDSSFTNTGKYFTGWNTKADGSGDSYASNELVQNLTDKEGVVTLYAIWSSESVEIDKFEFTKEEITLYANHNADNKLNAAELLRITGKDGKVPTDKSVAWKSSDDKVVTVSENGVITSIVDASKAVRYATVTAKNEKSGKEATLKVKVEYDIYDLRILDTTKTPKIYGAYRGTDNQYLHGDSAEMTVLEKGQISINVGKNFKLKADFLPKTKTQSGDNSAVYGEAILNQEVQWTSENASIATVDKNGKVTGVSAGETSICVLTFDRLGTYWYATTSVKVNEPAKGITLSQKSCKLGVKNTVKLSATVAPYDADQEVKWSVEKGKENIISVSASGLVTGLAKGTAKVIATTKDGKKSAKCTIKVGDRYDKIVIKGAGGKDGVIAGKKLKLTASFTDSAGNAVNPLNKDIVWQVADGVEHCDISSKGVLTGISEGKVKIQAISAIDSNVYGEKEIQVYVPYTKANIRDEEIIIPPGKSYLTYVDYELPANATDYPTLSKDVKWSLQKEEDSQYVKITDEFNEIVRIEAVKETTAPVVLQAKFTPYGGKEVVLTCKVTVANQSLKSLKLDNTSISINAGQYQFIEALLTPTVPTESGITWKLDDDKDKEYVELSPDGVFLSVKALKPTPKGHVVKVTATTEGTVDGKPLTATCNITVGEKAALVKVTNLKEEEVNLKEGKSIKLKSAVYAEDGNTLAGNQKVIYHSSNANVAKVDDTGRVTAIRTGMTEIAAISDDNPDVFKAVKVYVYKPVTKLDLDKKKVSLYLNSSGKNQVFEIIRPILTPEDASYDKAEVTWTVDDPSKIKWGKYSYDNYGAVKTEEELRTALGGASMVDATKEGIVTGKGYALAIRALKPGKVKLIATVAGKKKAVCNITIYTVVTGLRIKEDKGITATKDGNYTLTLDVKKNAKVKPMVDLYGTPYSDGTENAEQKADTNAYKNAKKFAKGMKVTYMSSNPSVADANSSGTIKAKAKGQATIFVTTSEGRFFKKIEVTVK